MSTDHQPHMLRAHMKEWCGGTEPPTMVVEYPANGMLEVEVYPVGADIHAGQLLRPTTRLEFLVPAGERLGVAQVGEYACRALQSLEHKPSA